MSSKTIADFYNHKVKPGDVGIEVEVEFQSGHPKLEESVSCWRPIEDGSLKYGMEYVTRNPIKVGPDKHGKIKDLTDALAKFKTNITNRCSVHVHRNVGALTPVEVWTIILAYWLLEAPLLAFCGDSRKANLFCLGVREAGGILERCYRDLENNNPFKTFQDESLCKYGGQNLSAIPRLGSLEYRGMRGTLDPDLIDLWSTTVFEIGERARKFKDPAELMDFYLDSEKDQFLQRLLPHEFIEHLIKITDYQSLIKRNALILCELAYYHDDWHAWQETLEIPDKVLRKKGLLEQLVEAQMSSAQINSSISVSTASFGD